MKNVSLTDRIKTPMPLALVLASTEFVRTNSLVRGNPLIPQERIEEYEMRKRNIRFELCLNEEENICLNELCHKTRLNKSTLIRYLILGYKPAEAPPIEYKVLIRELRAIGNNINQLIVIARSNGILNVSGLKKHLDELDLIENKMHEAFDFRK